MYPDTWHHWKFAG